MFAALALATTTIATTKPAPRPHWTPETITLSVSADPRVPRAIIPLALEEAAAIWRGAGLTLHWSLDDHDSHAGTPGTGETGCAMHVSIENGPPAAAGTMMPLGWIVFEADAPAEEIHLSFSNALALIQEADGAEFAFRMTQSERNTLLSRAMGRALAHELGHYLLESRAHTKSGLMQSGRPASDFFGPGRERFAIAPAQQRFIASRWTSRFGKSAALADQ